MSSVLKLQLEYKPCNIGISDRAKRIINRLRFFVVECRAAARLDIFEVCRIFDPEKPLIENEQFSIFVRTLGQAMDKSPIWLRPGCKDFSFDEKWLAAIFDAHFVKDLDSYDFLCRCRIEPYKRAIFNLMINNLAQFVRNQSKYK